MNIKYRMALDSIEKTNQTQMDLRSQLDVLRAFANKLGLYDAADYIKPKEVLSIDDEAKEVLSSWKLETWMEERDGVYLYHSNLKDKPKQDMENIMSDDKHDTLDLPKLYLVKSTRLGVEKPVEAQVVNIHCAARLIGPEQIPEDLYELNTYPYQVYVIRNETSSKDEGCYTGFGDVWTHTNFASFSLSEAEMYYQKECIRIETTYPTIQNTDTK